MSRPVVEAVGLTKRYGASTVVDGVNLAVDEGEIVGLLGPNGAGKTTTILMLIGLTEPSAGSVRVLDLDPLRDPLAVKTQVGYLPDSVGFYDGMTGLENLRYTARLGGIDASEIDDRIMTALQQVHLDHVANKRVGTYSRGMRQRLGLAELAMRQIRLAVLDEPTSGLDPRSTDELLDLIRAFAADGMTLLISSHMLDVVQSICTRVALFNKGKIGFMGSVEKFTNDVAGGSFQIDVAARKIDLSACVDIIPAVGAVDHRDKEHWMVSATHDVRPELARMITEHGGDLLSLQAHRASLSEAYNRFFLDIEQKEMQQ
ncbi:ABC transporter ATP-binding protein [uncultured Cohaesibacter sp.]|uniref:ABC transporter ATP-binding protein n=1 Tax=uncultured Cohaesibacter sp. TaxID=1002546 RepID=UPI0029C6318D|nr:ABC transporter ATP-binding protein [uncultured Cohaesibacter sp.]